MGYARYTIWRGGEQIEAGYDVEAVCERRWCRAKIDRGLAYLCGGTPGGDEWGCGGYFCGRHRFIPLVDDVPEMCADCLAYWERQQTEEFTDRLAELIGDYVHDIKDKPTVFADGLSFVAEFTDGREFVVQIPVSTPRRSPRLPSPLRDLLSLRPSRRIRG